MKLKLSRIAGKGTREVERLVFKADEDVDIGDYTVLIAEKSSAGKPRGGAIPHCFWFPDKVVKAGSTVVLYTKSGKRSEKENSSGSTSYFFYWDLDGPQFSEKVIPVLLQARAWDYPVEN